MSKSSGIYLGLAWFALACTGTGAPESPGGSGAAQGPPAVAVETALVEQGTITDNFDAVGTLQAGEAVVIAAEIDARVASLPFREGTKVTKGSTVVQLDDREARAELERAVARRDQLRTSYDRIQRVVDRGIVSPQDLDDARAALRVAEADVRLFETRLEKTRITAPWSGVIGARSVSVGAYVVPGTPLAELTALDEIKVVFPAPEKLLATLRLGTNVRLVTPAYPGDQVEGSVTLVDPVLDPITRTARITARVRNPESRLRPGMSVNVSVVLASRPATTIVPSEAVFFEGGQALVYVVDSNNKVHRAVVTLGARRAATVEILNGVSPGLTLVRAGQQKLFEGAAVTPVSQP